MTLNTSVTDTRWSPNFSAGRPAGAPDSITIHHWGYDGQTHQAVVDYLCTPRGSSSTSAHYVASAGRVTQLVHDYDRAWHAGPGGNPRSIGIECRPEMSADDFETVAALIAAIRAQHGHLPLVPHSHWLATACPGRWAAHLADLSARADTIAQGHAAPTPAPQTGAALVVDAWWGPATNRALQANLGTPADGVLSDQPAVNRPHFPRAGDGWEWVQTPSGGSTCVHALQVRLGVTPDGYAGPVTVTALQKRLNGGGL